MLMLTANWGIGDGTVHAGPRATAIEGFFSEVRRAAWRAGFRQDGSYRPVDRVQLVLAGDTLDGLCSVAWPNDIRPWRAGHRATVAKDRVAAGVARSGRRVWRHLRRMLRDGLTVPAADRRGRPTLGAWANATVSVCCVVGERERLFEATSIAAMALRSGIRLGVTMDGSSDRVRPLVERPPTLAESVIVDAIVPFVLALRRGAQRRREAASWLYRLARAPIADMPHIVRSWRTQTGDGSLLEAWVNAVAGWEVRARIDPPAVPTPFDAVAAVAVWLEQATRDPAVAVPADLAGLGLEGPASPPDGSLPLIVANDDTFSGIPEGAWTAAAARSSIVQRIGCPEEDSRIIDAA